MITMATHKEISSQWSTLRLVVFLCANCKFIISNFSEITFKSSASGSITVSPSKVLTGVSSASDMEISISESGTDSPCSHLEIVCLTTFSLMPSSSCESPFDFLIAFMFSFNILNNLFSSFVNAIVLGTARCCKQCILTWKPYCKLSVPTESLCFKVLRLTSIKSIPYFRNSSNTIRMM